MLCACHGVAAYWHRDPRRASGGSWRCAVQKRANDLRSDRDRKRKRQLVYWHKTAGGYVRRRRRDLATQRADVIERLNQLHSEGSSC